MAKDLPTHTKRYEADVMKQKEDEECTVKWPRGMVGEKERCSGKKGKGEESSTGVQFSITEGVEETPAEHRWSHKQL